MCLSLGQFSGIDTWQVLVIIPKANDDSSALLKELLQSGKVVPVIDRRYTLEQVPEAIRYLETGRARGKVVITMEDDV